ncbi:serine/threonine protein kinase [Micrococcus sp. EYE_162]|uniref:serine/threonine-protein kinase n=1 Tax=unclassified Micrococcus TaxID=2620948 RepID=UPI002004EAE3|nr:MULTISPECIES: serine/threonine-protein kinase [unclassified Micrococcus]MCK6094956.1 serine/threonine protein kinase [Micrococcus sp. EYE_212]MCK6170903.1 serine/threonine protein kinase [Micrococcus sp. EYE_162]
MGAHGGGEGPEARHGRLDPAGAEPGTAPEDAAEGGAPRVPGWEAVRLLGEGSQARVWLVRDAAGGEAALKVPRSPAAGDSLSAEAAALAHVRHPHLVAVLGTVPTDQGTGMLSEHRPAGSLADLVREAGPLTPGQAVTVLVPMAQALARLHEHGIVHGDVSPGNVLFGVDGSPALADLGVARVVGGAQGVGGTPGFAAPEVLRALQEAEAPAGGERAAAPDPLTAASDVFSWAALGWFALTGRAPGPHGSRAPLPVLVPEVPPELAILLDAALDPDPAGRPSALEGASAAYAAAAPEPVPLHEAAPIEVAHLLPTLLPGGGGPGTRRGRRRRTGGRGAVGRRGRRAPGPAVGLAAGAVALLAGLAVAGAVLHRTADGPADGPAAGEGQGPAAPTAPSAPASAAPASGTPPSSSTPGRPPDAAASSTRHGVSGEASGEAPGDPSTGTEASARPEELSEDAVALEEVLAGVGRSRTAALEDPRAERLEAYAVPGSPAWRRDAAVQRDLAGGGYAFAGLTVSVEPDGAAEVEGDALRVPARIVTSAHAVQDGAGAVVGDVEERDEAVELTLRADGTRWRVERVDPR